MFGGHHYPKPNSYQIHVIFLSITVDTSCVYFFTCIYSVFVSCYSVLYYMYMHAQFVCIITFFEDRTTIKTLIEIPVKIIVTFPHHYCRHIKASSPGLSSLILVGLVLIMPRPLQTALVNSGHTDNSPSPDVLAGLCKVSYGSQQYIIILHDKYRYLRKTKQSNTNQIPRHVVLFQRKIADMYTGRHFRRKQGKWKYSRWSANFKEIKNAEFC